MLRVGRFLCFVVFLVLVSAGGCDDDPPGSRPPSSTTSATPTPSTASTTPGEITDSSSAASSSSTERLSGIATRTGITITRDGRPIDAAGLRAIGWTSLDAGLGQAHWSDPGLGEISVTWEVPDQRAVAFIDVSFWGDVTGQNLAMNPSMSTSVFTGGPLEAAAHSIGGVKAETPTERLRVTVPEQLAGTTASVSINLGFPQPVLVTYSYRYE